jgi:ankyrin repeat protein
MKIVAKMVTSAKATYGQSSLKYMIRCGKSEAVMNTKASLIRHIVVLLTMFAWNIPAFCSEISDAAKVGDLAKVKELLRNNPELVSYRVIEGYTPLHWAVQEGHKDVVEWLVTHNAEVNAKATDAPGTNVSWPPLRLITPLHLAALKGHKNVAELLLANKADVNARDASGWTPLHVAAQRCRKNMVKLLLAKGAEVNAKDIFGKTPLHVAALGGRKDVAELLLANKAEVNTKTNSMEFSDFILAGGGLHAFAPCSFDGP